MNRGVKLRKLWLKKRSFVVLVVVEKLMKRSMRLVMAQLWFDPAFAIIEALGLWRDSVFEFHFSFTDTVCK